MIWAISTGSIGSFCNDGIFKRDGNDLDKVERYQAEALVHRHLPMDAVLGIGCYSDSVASFIQEQIKKVT